MSNNNGNNQPSLQSAPASYPTQRSSGGEQGRFMNADAMDIQPTGDCSKQVTPAAQAALAKLKKNMTLEEKQKAMFEFIDKAADFTIVGTKQNSMYNTLQAQIELLTRDIATKRQLSSECANACAESEFQTQVNTEAGWEIYKDLLCGRELSREEYEGMIAEEVHKRLGFETQEAEEVDEDATAAHDFSFNVWYRAGRDGQKAYFAVLKLKKTLLLQSASLSDVDKARIKEQIVQKTNMYNFYFNICSQELAKVDLAGIRLILEARTKEEIQKKDERELYRCFTMLASGYFQLHPSFQQRAKAGLLKRDRLLIDMGLKDPEKFTEEVHLDGLTSDSMPAFARLNRCLYGYNITQKWDVLYCLLHHDP